MSSKKKSAYTELISSIIGLIIILVLISIAKLPVITGFMFTGAQTVDIHDEALTDGLLITDNGSYSQSFTVEEDNLSSICLELTSNTDSIANFSISLYGEESEAVSTTEFDDLETKDYRKYYWNIDDIGLIAGETAVFNIFMGGSENGNNPIINSVEYKYGQETLSASRLAMLILILVLLALIFSMAYLGITRLKASSRQPSVSENTVQKHTSRRVYFEIMRVLACALVIFNHLPVYDHFADVECESRTLFMTLTMITRINVPVFFMVSGALLLQKDEDFTAVFKKRFLRIIGLLAVFYLINIAALQYNSFLKGSYYDISAKQFLLGFIRKELPGADVYWYLYAYLGYLFMLPLLQRIAKGITRAEFWALIMLHFIISSLIPMLNLYFAKNGIGESIWLDEGLHVPFAVVQAMFYPLIGYYLEYRVDIKKVRFWHLCPLIMGAAIGITLSNICTYADAELNGTFSQSYVMLFDYLTAISVFMLIKYLYTLIKAGRRAGIGDKVFCFIGSMTLGIYMFDPVFRKLFYQMFIDKTQFFSVAEQGLLWILFSMTLGIICTFLLKKISLFKKLL